MPGLNDYHAFKSTSSGRKVSSGKPNNSDNSGGDGGCLPWVLVALAILGFLVNLID